MSYPALPDRRMSYDNDGTVVMVRSAFRSIGATPDFSVGPNVTLTGTDRQQLNDVSYDALTSDAYNRLSSPGGTTVNEPAMAWFFFPEVREVTAIAVGMAPFGAIIGAVNTMRIEGSNDTTNGVDGTWEAATIPSGNPNASANLDEWRVSIKPISFTGPKKVIRIALYAGLSWQGKYSLLHLYGAKAAGETPDDILYLDGSAGFAEFSAAADFGDRPLGTTSTRTFKVKNGSATKTANTINIQCNDADFAISTDNATWVVTINIASLAAGASSSTLYVRNTTPAPGNPLGPRFARIVCTVGSWV